MGGEGEKGWRGGERDFTVRSDEFEGSTSIPGDVDVRETIEIVFLHLLSH